MKKIILICSLLISSGVLFAQSMYSTTNNRVILSTIVNSDTVIVENLQNKVRINGDLHLFEVDYENYTSRLIGTAKNLSDERTDIHIRFYNEYLWLDERIKTTENNLEFVDDLIVEIGGREQTIPASFNIHRIRGGQGFNVMIEVRGKFNGEGIEDDFPNLKFETDLDFAIFLTVNVVN
ncbi:MAG: hypothetical protein ACPGRC_01670 [Salibacteraceae bacterium]